MIDRSDHPLAQELWSLPIDAPPSIRVAAALRAYVSATGRLLDDPPTADQRTEAATWMIHENMAVDGHSTALLHRPRRAIWPLVHPRASDKASWLRQASCPICESDEDAEAAPISFGIPIKPFSAQVSKKHVPEIKRRIRENLATRLDFGRSWEGAKVCAWVVAVMGAHDRDKDVDNLVKGILDAIQGKVYSNDASIQHLNATKIRHASPDGYYLVSVRPVRGYLDDVIDPDSVVIWPGIPKIEI